MVSHPVTNTKSLVENRSTMNEVHRREQLIARLRCKAEACRVACLESNTSTKDPCRRRQCEDEAKTLQVDLWVLRSRLVHGGVSQEVKVLGDCIEATAMAVENLTDVIRAAVVSPKATLAALSRLAEAQSMMRVATQAVQKKIPGYRAVADIDQVEAYKFLTRTAKRGHFGLARHARLNDPANPADVSRLLDDLNDMSRTTVTNWRRR